MSGQAEAKLGAPSRRRFLKLAPLVPLAAGQVTQAAVEALTQQGSVAALTGVSAGASGMIGCTPSIGGPGIFSRKLLALHKLGLLPEWFKRDSMRNSRYEASTLDPDVAGLVSVSLSAKCRIQMERLWEAKLARMEGDLLDDLARSAFWEECSSEDRKY